MAMGLHDFQFFTLETLIVQTIVLLLIIWVLNRFIFQPYLQYLDKESEKREKLENDYNNIEKLHKEALDEKENILSSARKDAEKMRKDASDLAKKEAQNITNQAMIDAENLKQASMSQIQKEKENMLLMVREKSIDLVLKFNAKLFEKEGVNKDFVEKEIKSIT